MFISSQPGLPSSPCSIARLEYYSACPVSIVSFTVPNCQSLRRHPLPLHFGVPCEPPCLSLWERWPSAARSERAGGGKDHAKGGTARSVTFGDSAPEGSAKGPEQTGYHNLLSFSVVFGRTKVTRYVLNFLDKNDTLCYTLGVPFEGDGAGPSPETTGRAGRAV